MAAPEEILAFTLDLWLADVGTAFPLIDDVEASFAEDWGKLGTEGSLNYDENGVIIGHSETVFDFTPAGSTMVAKRFRTGENLLTKLGLVDVSPDQYAKVMNDAAITTIAAASGVAGSKEFDLYRGDKVAQFAILMRGVSPVDNDLVMHYKVPKAFVSVNGDVTYNKGVVAALPIEIEMIRHSSADNPKLQIQTAVALA
jgi:hypothetical protein